MDAVLVVVLLTFVGFAASVLLGWAESEEPFNPRKLVSAIVRGAVPALGLGLLFVETHPVLTPVDMVVLVFTPLGLDYSSLKAWKIYKKGATKTEEPIT